MNDFRRARPLLLAVLLAGSAHAADNALVRYRPSEEELRASYVRAEQIGREYTSRAFKLTLAANWVEGGKRFWYRNALPGGKSEYILVESATGAKTPAFDHPKLAAALSSETGSTVAADALPFREIEFVDGGKALRFDIQEQGWKLNLADYRLEKVAAKRAPRRFTPGPWRQDMYEPNPRPVISPDGAWTAWVLPNGVRLKAKDGEPFDLTRPEAADKTFVSRLEWTPDSKRVIATRVTPGDRKKVYLIESSPKDATRGVMQERVYDQPGDRVDTFELSIVDVAARTDTPIQAERVDYGGLPDIRWKRDKRHFTFDRIDRGYGRWRIFEVDSTTGQTKTLVDDDPETFFDSTAMYVWYAKESDNIVWRSERSGWGHLYLTDGDGKIRNQITKGNWVVRAVQSVDESAKQIVFSASGTHAGEDPYFLHYYRVNFDGSGLNELTPATGTHSIQMAPDGKTLVDTYSTVTAPPVHELRRADDGKLIAKLENADITALRTTDWKAPEPFVAKARDGKTDIYGIIIRPSKMTPGAKYPVIEDIYAGPQDSFVPKTFAAYRRNQSLAELGFVVVQIDGMGTRNRSKAFHDVCYKNLADAGLPDRILWMKAAAAKYPEMDVDRVGVFGTSAGGQSSTGAVLFHPEFYKVAVSSCGCHDNRIDKIWWNEQWMGPMGPHYGEQSNITNASKLQGNLLLMVGELDDNVPPESTYQLADALIKANRDFDFLVLTGQRHTNGGDFGERKRRDFFVRHLIGVEPPSWNAK